MFAGGIDLQPFDNFWLGGEVVHRKLETPLAVFNAGSGTFEGTEMRWRGYANATFFDAFAVSTGFEYTDVESDLVRRTGKITTTKVPVSVSYFHNSGAFANVTGTWLRQKITDTSNSGASSSDSGFLMDFAVGYRLPNKRGVFSFEVQNVFDKRLNIQDETTFNARPLSDSVARERSFMARFTVPLN